MALRKPLVIVSGQIQQIQAGDTLDASVAEQEVVILTNGQGGAVAHVIGAPVYISAGSTAKKAANTSATLSNVIALAAETSIADAAPGSYLTSGVLTATTAQWDAVAGTTGGLVAGTTYYLAGAGLLTSTPTTTAGEYVVPVGVAISTTSLKLKIDHSVLL